MFENFFPYDAQNRAKERDRERENADVIVREICIHHDIVSIVFVIVQIMWVFWTSSLTFECVSHSSSSCVCVWECGLFLFSSLYLLSKRLYAPIKWELKSNIYLLWNVNIAIDFSNARDTQHSFNQRLNGEPDKMTNREL